MPTIDFDRFVEEQRQDPEFEKLLEEAKRKLREDDDGSIGVREPTPNPLPSSDIGVNS